MVKIVLCRTPEIAGLMIMTASISFETSYFITTSVLLPGSNPDEIARALTEKMQTVPAGFFTSQPLVADLTGLPDFVPDTAWLTALKALFAGYQLTLVGITGADCSPEALTDAGLAAIDCYRPKRRDTSVADNPLTSPPVQAEPVQDTVAAAVSESEWKECKVFSQTVRSGQCIYAADSDLAIIGSVNAGAEVYADGNVYVYGCLRGRAFAGVKGKKEKFIYCQELRAELVSVAGLYKDMEQLQEYDGNINVLIRLSDDETIKIGAR